jgi:hypothetical protein
VGVKVGRMHGLRTIWNDSPETIPVAQRLRIHHTDTLSPTPMHTNDLRTWRWRRARWNNRPDSWTCLIANESGGPKGHPLTRHVVT